jgi:hypothetical protein
VLFSPTLVLMSMTSFLSSLVLFWLLIIWLWQPQNFSIFIQFDVLNLSTFLWLYSQIFLPK